MRELTPGELVAYSAGKEIITTEQMAVCYLCSESRVNDRDVVFGPGIGSDIALECGLNPETFRRTCNKFELVFKDLHEDPEYTKSEAIYSKILEHYAKFSDMTLDEVRNIAKEAFNDDNRQIGQQLKYAHDAKLKKYSEVKKQVDEKAKFALINLYNSLKKSGFNGEKAKKSAIKKISTEFDKSEQEVTRIWNISFK